MNSFMQQLFMVPAFRESVLAVGEVPASEAAPLEDNLLYQLQVLFGQLKISQKRHYETLPFCKSNREPNGQLINLSEQKDCQEFAGQLFDKLDTLLKQTQKAKAAASGLALTSAASASAPVSTPHMRIA